MSINKSKEYSCEDCQSSKNSPIIPPETLFREWRVRKPKALSDMVQTGYKTTIVGCDQCGLVYRDERPEADEILRLYEEEKLNLDYAERWKKSWIPIYNRILTGIEKKTGHKGILLDIGSQLGLLPEIARSRGWEAYGIDPSDITARESSKLNIPLVQGASPQLPFAENSFDVVTCLTVFENLPHFTEDLQQLRRVLKPNGLLVLKVANFDFYEKITSLSLSGKLAHLRDEILINLHLLGWPYQYGFRPEKIRDIIDIHGFNKIEILNYPLAYLGNNKFFDNIRKLINAISSTIKKATDKITSPWMEIYARNEDKTKNKNIEITPFYLKDQLIVKDFVIQSLKQMGFKYNNRYDFDLEDINTFYLQNGGAFFFLKEGEKIIGTIGIEIKDENVVEIKRFYVDPAYQNMGNGNSLAREALSFCNDLAQKNDKPLKVKATSTTRSKIILKMLKRYGLQVVDISPRNEILLETIITPQRDRAIVLP